MKREAGSENPKPGPKIPASGPHDLSDFTDILKGYKRPQQAKKKALAELQTGAAPSIPIYRPLRAHIARIRDAKGQEIAVQLRLGNGGPGLSRYFPYRKCGGAEAAWSMAHMEAHQAGAQMSTGHRGGRVDRGLNSNNKTGASGIQFHLADGEMPGVQVIATWIDQRSGKAVTRRASANKHGLEGALDLMIKAREKGAKVKLDKSALFAALWEFNRGVWSDVRKAKN